MGDKRLVFMGRPGDGESPEDFAKRVADDVVAVIDSPNEAASKALSEALATPQRFAGKSQKPAKS